MSDKKNCPYCGTDLTPGYIQSPRLIIWSKNKHRLSFKPDSANGDLLVQGQNVLGAYRLAWRCPGCSSIIIRDLV